jgi:hypothetical protein
LKPLLAPGWQVVRLRSVGETQSGPTVYHCRS